MRNENLISELDLFLRVIEDYENATNRQKEINNDIEALNISKNSLLEAFDEEYLPKYIKDKIGDSPKDFALYNPMKLIKPLANKKSDKFQRYYENQEKAIKQYYMDFANERSKIEQEAQIDYNQKLSVLNAEGNELDLKIENLKNQINGKKLLPQKFISSDSIRKIITYLEEWRADNIKEAIVILCFEEELKQHAQEIDSKLMKLEKDIHNFNKSIKEEIEIKFDDINSSLNDLNDRLNNWP
ncbi:hypothetical protein PHG01_00038 [Streptococcus mutans PKUSS-HG01]|uniref:hypothetical protein n=1 Tax=Streptococcus mutans TaxID=1309 RepID=UPI0003C414A3|nr:hypothetical protein [Streptococcus mutans]ESS19515.1 hypothetical protein PHG01_00038 [Streptococcus mutans PKUSS-HG01]